MKQLRQGMSFLKILLLSFCLLACWQSKAWAQKPSWAPAASRELWRDDANIWNDLDVGGEVRGRFLGIQHIFSTLPDTAATVTIEGVSFTPRSGSIIGVASATSAINLYYLSYNNIKSATEWVAIGQNALTAAGVITEATAGELLSNTYELEIELPAGKRVVGEWPVVWVGGVVYPEDAVLEPGAQLQHVAIHLYLHGGEAPWPAGTAWKAIYSLESVSVVAVAAGTGGDMVLPTDVAGIDYVAGNAVTFE